MTYHRIGFFVVPADERDELAVHLARWNASVDDFRDDGTQVLTNQIFRHAQSRAISQWRYAHPLAYTAEVHILSHLSRKCDVFKSATITMPADCPVVARAVDDLVARRGGQDAFIRHLTKLTLGEIPHGMIRDVYVAFRTGLATAVELGAALVCIHYRPGAEGELAAKRAREAARRAREPEEWTPEQEEAMARWMREIQEPIIETEPVPFAVASTHHDLYLVPEPYISEIMTIFAESDAVYAAGEGDAWERGFELSEKAQLMASEEWQRMLNLELRGQTSAWKSLDVTLNEFRPGKKLSDDLGFTPAEMRALFATLCDWQASVGGRDAAVAHLAEKSYGHHLGLTGQTYDAVFALYQYGAEHGCGIVDSQSYDMA